MCNVMASASMSIRDYYPRAYYIYYMCGVSISRMVRTSPQ